MVDLLVPRQQVSPEVSCRLDAGHWACDHHPLPLAPPLPLAQGDGTPRPLENVVPKPLVHRDGPGLRDFYGFGLALHRTRVEASRKGERGGGKARGEASRRGEGPRDEVSRRVGAGGNAGRSLAHGRGGAERSLGLSRLGYADIVMYMYIESIMYTYDYVGIYIYIYVRSAARLRPAHGSRPAPEPRPS